MKRKAGIIVGLLVAGFACRVPANKEKSVVPDSAVVQADSAMSVRGKSKGSADSLLKLAPSVDSGQGYVLSYKSDSVERTLRLVKRDKDAMDFSLILTNSIAKVSDTIRGGLVFVDSGGDENETADDGLGFFFDNWNYTDRNGCQINFTIDSDSARYVHIYDFGCAEKLKTPIPVESKHILKRIDLQ